MSNHDSPVDMPPIFSSSGTEVPHSVHGGTRPGAGRKPKLTRPFTYQLRPSTDAMLQALAEASGLNDPGAYLDALPPRSFPVVLKFTDAAVLTELRDEATKHGYRSISAFLEATYSPANKG